LRGTGGSTFYLMGDFKRSRAYVKRKVMLFGTKIPNLIRNQTQKEDNSDKFLIESEKIKLQNVIAE